MPAGFDATEPVPLPPLVATVSVYCCSSKLAVTMAAALSVTVHVLVPLHPLPLHPVKTESALADAVNVTLVPALYVSLQSLPQLMPAGFDVTVPVPEPVLVITSVWARANDALTGVSPV